MLNGLFCRLVIACAAAFLPLTAAHAQPLPRNVAAALVGASRPEQVHENVKAAGVKLEDEALKRIDEVLGDVVERDPGKTRETTPKGRVA